MTRGLRVRDAWSPRRPSGLLLKKHVPRKGAYGDNYGWFASVSGAATLGRGFFRAAVLEVGLQERVGARDRLQELLRDLDPEVFRAS